MSLYAGVLTDTGIARNMLKLKGAFPKQSPEFFNILTERLIANGFTDERLTDAVNEVIDNFGYKELNISDIIRYDRRVKLYTYNEAADLVTKGRYSFGDFEIREVNGKKYWILKSELHGTI